MSKVYIKAFKNTNKQDGDNKPLYSNSKVEVKEKMILDPERVYSVGLWKNEDGSLNIKIELKDEELNQSPDI